LRSDQPLAQRNQHGLGAIGHVELSVYRIANGLIVRDWFICDQAR
jgi:hypothetical protein